MEAIEVKLYVPSADTKIRIYALGDVHWGAPLCDEELLKKTVSTLAEAKHNYWIGMGDYIDNVVFTDRKRFNPKDYKGTDVRVEDLIDLPLVQVEGFVETINPIRGRCLALFEGNHEWISPKYQGRDIIALLAGSVNAPELGASGFVRVKVYHESAIKHMDTDHPTGPMYTVTFFCHHGYGGGRLSGAPALQLDRAPMHAQADIYMFGHRHKQMIMPTVTYNLLPGNPPKIVRSHKIAMQTGSYLRTAAQLRQPGYAEKQGYYPAVMGSPYVDIWADIRYEEGNKNKRQHVRRYQASHPPVGDDPV